MAWPASPGSKRLVTLTLRSKPKAVGSAARTGGAHWINVVPAKLKRVISGVYHTIHQAKYAWRYLAEAAYRFSRRLRLREMLPRLGDGADTLQALF